MKIVEIRNMESVQTPHSVDVRNLYDKESAQVMHITLRPGESLKPHITPVDVFFFILEGAPHVLVGDEKIQVHNNSLIESPKDIVHCLYNETSTICRILVVKAPKPQTQARLL